MGAGTKGNCVSAAWEPPQLGGIQKTHAASKKQMLRHPKKDTLRDGRKGDVGAENP